MGCTNGRPHNIASAQRNKSTTILILMFVRLKCHFTVGRSKQHRLQVTNPNKNSFQSSPFPPILNNLLINLFSFLPTLLEASS